ncbi:MAG TPA: glycosyltransferase family 2 protein [Candidatus Polarisedimenticolia bacterium]|nr:glycosyltransferase family 2 protein [Candidatus Polarisedimenticolia bacterium]
MPDLSLVVPCYNEEEIVGTTISDLLTAFGTAGHDLEIVAVDNGSTDRTGDILRDLTRRSGRIVCHRIEVNRGYGNGLLAGLPLATAPWVGITCADGQVSAPDTVKLYEIAARSSGAKLVKVRRRFRMDGFPRKITSITYNVLTATLFGGLGSIDINGNPKIIPRSYLERMNLQSKDWFLDAEIMIKAKRLALPVIEMNIMAQMREGGKSNVRPGTCWEFVLNLLRYRFGGAAPHDAGNGEPTQGGPAR